MKRSPARFELRPDRAQPGLWVLKDRERPAFRGSYGSRELALHSMDNRIRLERGLPALAFFTHDDVKAAMRYPRGELHAPPVTPAERHVNAPCSVEPVEPMRVLRGAARR